MSKIVYQIKYNRPNIFRIEGFRFMPGINFINDSEWNRIKNHPLLPYRFKENHLEFLKGRGPEDYSGPELEDQVDESPLDGENESAPLAKKMLSAYSVKEAKAIILETYDYRLLMSWKELDQRKTILSAIEEQIEKINSQEEKQEKKDD